MKKEGWQLRQEGIERGHKRGYNGNEMQTRRLRLVDKDC